MSIPFVDLKAQYLSMKEEIDQAIASTINNTQFIGGEPVRSFEAEFAAYVGVDHCITCGNGSDSLEIILQAIGVGPGDEVIVPANSWISTAEAVNNVGAEPVFIDVEEFTRNLDLNLVESLITNRTKAIMPVHLFGLPADMNSLNELAEAHGLKVIEDSAQAVGALYKGRKTGTFGHAASFSFYPGKNLGAYGDAGAIVTNDEELAERIRRIANHGQIEKHDHQFLGRNSRLDSLQAAILNAKLPHLENWIQGRNQVAQWYNRYLGDHVVKPVIPENHTHDFHLYVIQVQDRAHLIQKLEYHEIGYSIHYPVPLPFVEAYRYKRHQRKDFPVSDKLSKEILSLPIYPELTEEQVKTICEVVNGP